jgi:hypothetical protein
MRFDSEAGLKFEFPVVMIRTFCQISTARAQPNRSKSKMVKRLNVDMSVPHKKRRVHFSESSLCRPLVSKVWNDSESKAYYSSDAASSPVKISNLIDFECPGENCVPPCSVHQIQGKEYDLLNQSCDSDDSDFEIRTKQQDGPSSVAQMTDALVLQYLMKDSCGEEINFSPKADNCTEADEIDQDTFASTDKGATNPSSTCTLDTDLWPQVCARLQLLARRLATTGRASLLPSASLLRTHHLPTLQFLASTINIALGDNENDPTALARLESDDLPPSISISK